MENDFRIKKINAKEEVEFHDKGNGLARATGVHERNTVPYARFALKKRHDFCATGKKTCKGTD